MAEPHGAGEHAHPGFDVGGTVADIVGVADEHFEIAEGEVFEHQVEVLVFGGEDGEERDDVWVLEFLEVLQFADRVGGHALCVFLLDLDLLDGDAGCGAGAEVTEEDDGVGTFTELLALDVFALFLLVHLLGEVEGRSECLAGWRGCEGGFGGAIG